MVSCRFSLKSTHFLSPFKKTVQFPRPKKISQKPSETLWKASPCSTNPSIVSRRGKWLWKIHGCGKPTKRLVAWRYPGWWFGTCLIFPYIGNVIIPVDFHIFQGVGQPPTSIMSKVPFTATNTMTFWYFLGHSIGPSFWCEAAERNDSVTTSAAHRRLEKSETMWNQAESTNPKSWNGATMFSFLHMAMAQN